MPRFNKNLDELESRFDKWLYVIKNLNRLDSVPDKLRERVFEKLFEVAEIARFTPEQINSNEDSLKYHRDLKNSLDTAFEKVEKRVEKKVVWQRLYALRKCLRSMSLWIKLFDIPVLQRNKFKRLKEKEKTYYNCAMGKKKHNTPRRKRMKREARLASGKYWLDGYSGKNIVKSYAKWYGVDLICAKRELRMLGILISAEYEAQLRRSIEDKARANKARKKQAEQKIEEAHFRFAFIAGYTSGGIPYGLSNEELFAEKEGERFGEDELPF